MDTQLEQPATCPHEVISPTEGPTTFETVRRVRSIGVAERHRRSHSSLLVRDALVSFESTLAAAYR
jgi:hypothetical protein